MDRHLFFLINRDWTHPALDRLMAAVSSLDVWMPGLLLLVAIVAWKGRARARWFLLCLGLVLLVNDAVIGDALKHLVRRPRPFQSTAGVRQLDLDRRARPRLLALWRPLESKVSTDFSVAANPPGGGRSFPSNHTTNNFCAATVLTIFYRRRGLLWFLPATLVGYSRIYVGSHWPSDVLASAVLAVGWTLAAFAGLRWALRHRGDRGPAALRIALGLPNHSP